MIMFNKLPYSVYLENKKYKINVDFRNMISFENKIQDKSVSKPDKIKYGLQHFYFDFKYDNNYQFLLNSPQLYKKACDKLIWFYKCGRENYHKSINGKSPNKEIYSYKYDDEYIFGAFWEQFGIDLTLDKVHWWKFKAFLKTLKDDTEFVKIKGYRAYTGDDKNLLELKKYWELPLPVEEQERLDKLYNALK